MKFYVDEMPKNCKNCNFGYANNLCEIDYDIDFKEFDKNKKHINCPLHALSTRDQQIRADERKKVVQEIKESLKKAHLEIMSSIDLYSYTDNFLYQVEKGESNERN